MKTNHGYKDLNSIKSVEEIDFRGVIGSIRLRLKRIKMKYQSESMVQRFLSLKF
ncbi:hypothetical protein [Draconibacterium sediminis]|uniref:hypothetical protein n=1 Tax=Draconibacterium sediminis TaxID=1544798 RepID=UPI0012FB3043|nr:hypothetical protein [Draconibacterium sediminis]